MPTSTTNIYSIALRLLPNTPFAVSVSADNKRQEKPPVLMRGVPAILQVTLFRDGARVTAEELAAEYSSFRLVVAQDFDENTEPLLVSDETGATIDAENDRLVLPMTSMNTETLEALIGTRERLDLGAELQLFKPVVQDEPIEAWQFPIGVQNRRDLTGTATPAPGSVNYYKKDETDNLLNGKIAISEKGAADGVPELDANGTVPPVQLPVATSSEIGAVKVRGNGINVNNTTSEIYVVAAGSSEIAMRLSNYKPIVPSNLNVSVIAALTDANHIELTAAEQATAQGVLGAYGTLHLDAAPTTSTVGAFGQHAIDTATGKCYTCTAVTVDETDPQNPVTTYTWANDMNENGGRFSNSLLIDNNPARFIYFNNQYSVIDVSNQRIWLRDKIIDIEGNTTAGGSLRIKDGNGASNYMYNNGVFYAKGTYQQAITVIPSATTAYTLAEGVQSHEPTAVPTYTLPAVTDTTRTHAIDLKVKFSAGVLTYSFLDSQGGTVTPLAQPEIAAGTVVDFLCEYDPLSSQWVVMPLVMVEGGAA